MAPITADRPLRWGIISAGKICHDFVNSLATLDKSEHEVVAVAARNINSAEAFAKKHGTSMSLQQMLKSSKG